MRSVNLRSVLGEFLDEFLDRAFQLLPLGNADAGDDHRRVIEDDRHAAVDLLQLDGLLDNVQQIAQQLLGQLALVAQRLVVVQSLPTVAL